MKKNSELPKLRIETELFEKMYKCLEAINQQTGINISMTSFRRMAYKHFTELVLSKGLTIDFKPS